MDKENVTEGFCPLASVSLTPRTPLQDVINSHAPMQSLGKELYTPVTPQLKSDSSPAEIPEFKLSATSEENLEDVPLNALVYQKVMAMLHEKEQEFENQISEKDALIEKLEQALTQKVDEVPKRRRSKLPVSNQIRKGSDSSSKPVQSKVSPTKWSDASRRMRLKPINAIPLRTKVVEPVKAASRLQLPVTVKRIYPAQSTRRRSSSKSSSSNDEDVKTTKKYSPKDLGNSKPKNTKGNVKPISEVKRGEKISEEKKVEKNPETEALILQLQETVDSHQRTITDLQGDQRWSFALSEKEAVISEQSAVVTKHENNVKHLQEMLRVEQESLIESTKAKDHLITVVQHQNKRIDLLEKDLMHSRESVREMSVVKEQLDIMQKTTKETEYFMEEERVFLANEVADKSNVIAHLEEKILELTTDLEAIENEKQMLQFEMDSTKAKAQELLFDKAAEMDSCLQGVVSLSTGLENLHARLLKESHHWGHTGLVVDSEEVTSEGQDHLHDEITACGQKLMTISDDFCQLHSAVQQKCSRYEDEIDGAARQKKTLEYQLSQLEATVQMSEAAQKRHKHQLSEAQMTITRQESEYQELNEILQAKTKALEECLDKEFSSELLTAELAKCQQMLSQSEVEGKEMKRALDGDESRENGAIIRENISLKCQVVKLQQDFETLKQEAKGMITKANQRMQVLESNWCKSEAEILKMDDLIDCVRLCLRPNLSRLLSFESNSLDRALKELGLYSGAATPAKLFSTKKK